MPQILLRPELLPRDGTQATFRVTLRGVPIGREIEVEIWEVDKNPKAGRHGGEQKLGSVKGKVQRLGDHTPAGPLLTLKPSSPATAPNGAARIGIVFPGDPDVLCTFALPGDRAGQHEGDWWEIQARVAKPVLRSSVLPVARVRRAVSTGVDNPQATYHWHSGHQVQLYADASEDETGTKGAYADIHAAIDQAENFIFMADWSFHPYLRLTRGAKAALDQTLGAKLVRRAQANPNLLIAIHTWDHVNKAMPDPQNDWGEEVLASIAGSSRPKNLRWRASSRTGEGGGPGFGWSHHQKFVVLDAPHPSGKRQVKAFLGGLDLTKGRFDWREHVILPADPHAAHFREQIRAMRPRIGRDKTADYDDWYSGEFGEGDDHDRDMPREPWHDVYCRIEGASAFDVVREFVGRWNLDPSWADAMGDDSKDDVRAVQRKFVSLFDATKFVQQSDPDEGPWSAQLVRSIVHEHWGASDLWKEAPEWLRKREFRWPLKGDVESSIQAAYVQAISQAERFVYIETQYFIGSGSKWDRSGVKNRVPETIVARTLDRIEKGLPFHTYIVVPMFPEGDPTSAGNVAQRMFQWNTINYMILALQAKVAERWSDYITFAFPARWTDKSQLDGGALLAKGDRKTRVKHNKRYMIYVHSKAMIVDDRYAIVGSANLNERSLAGGRDTEIAMTLWPSSNQNEETCVAQLQAFRQRLWEEHLGSQLPSSWKSPESASCVRDFQTAAFDNYARFRSAGSPEGRGHLCTWPLHVSPTTFEFEAVEGDPQFGVVIADGVYDKAPDAEWYTYPPHAGRILARMDIAE
jgi:phospholipase D1/2